MSIISLDKECGCFKRSDFENNQSFASKDDALMEAQKMVNHMNEKFCGKHAFTLSENGDDFSITLGQPAPASSGCCGGGHCS